MRTDDRPHFGRAGNGSPSCGVGGATLATAGRNGGVRDPDGLRGGIAAHIYNRWPELAKALVKANELEAAAKIDCAWIGILKCQGVFCGR